MSNQSLKEVITHAVIGQLPVGQEWSHADALTKWWMTGRRDGGLRLTEIGDMSFRISEIEFYDYEFNVKLEGGWHGYILELNNKIKCPYFLGVNKSDAKKNQPYLRLYDSKIAIMVSLYGNIQEYLKSVKAR
jgi:hypothetical protein